MNDDTWSIAIADDVQRDAVLARLRVEGSR